MSSLGDLVSELEHRPRLRAVGKVVGVNGSVVLARIPNASIGDRCTITLRNGRPLSAQVISFREDVVSLAPFDHIEGVYPGAPVEHEGKRLTVEISDDLIGTVVDATGRRMTGFFNETTEKIRGTEQSVHNRSPDPLLRTGISQTLITGVGVLDGLLTIGYGQRLGLFASAGVGKSTLLGMIARNAAVDVTIIALIGERGREVREFIDDSLGPDGLKRAIVVVSTSDESPLRRELAALTATAIAEHFRAQGKRVLLLVDSLTRMARAIRDVRLAAGELPVRQGYPASVYTELPRLLERAGTDEHGSITAIYTVLTNPENDVDPLGDEIKSILDGHIVLDPKLAELGIRPAVDVTTSISRLLPRLHSPEYLSTIQTITRILSRLKRDRDILLFGGTPDHELKAALECEQELLGLITQKPGETTAFHLLAEKLTALASQFRKSSVLQ